MWPEPAPGAPGAVPADPGMDSEGWFAVNGWKYLVKWHHSGSYQLYPGKVPRGLRALSWLAGAGWLAPSAGTCAAWAGSARQPAPGLWLVPHALEAVVWARCSGETMVG